ncbi:uncharacterized protein SCDLUD_003535 [Saccharomycodes ludwigii]|uniref:uncharacterized protein n=1 Tax=Saccharomycodes ludwigii TaxID=36035 RepID=UPI001E895D59|nr:hypothetical protein SCDLUD_003535 [Saccharomycodes ludwigii]KAH3900547.1 hypothetical protein SCDLUD_003535 [Saccharomycodes ludwigii]
MSATTKRGGVLGSIRKFKHLNNNITTSTRSTPKKLSTYSIIEFGSTNYYLSSLTDDSLYFKIEIIDNNSKSINFDLIVKKNVSDKEPFCILQCRNSGTEINLIYFLQNTDSASPIKLKLSRVQKINFDGFENNILDIKSLYEKNLLINFGLELKMDIKDVTAARGQMYTIGPMPELKLAKRNYILHRGENSEDSKKYHVINKHNVYFRQGNETDKPSDDKILCVFKPNKKRWKSSVSSTLTNFGITNNNNSNNNSVTNNNNNKEETVLLNRITSSVIGSSYDSENEDESDRTIGGSSTNTKNNNVGLGINDLMNNTETDDENGLSVVGIITIDNSKLACSSDDSAFNHMIVLIYTFAVSYLKLRWEKKLII